MSNYNVDFESLLVPIDKTMGDTKLYQKHIPIAFCVDGFTVNPITYLGKDSKKLEKRS